jgi:HEAT repeat protein
LLGAIKDPDAVPILTRALDDPDPNVRIEATSSLGRWGRGVTSDAIIAKLMPALSPDLPVDLRDASLATLEVLGRDQERVARAIADVATKDPSPRVRHRAVGFMTKPVFGFQVPALIAALDDPDTQVRLTAGTSLASIGLADDRVVPALCHAALNADELTREGIGMNFDRLVLDKASDKVPDAELTRRYRKAIQELRSVLETRKAAAREQMINVLGTVILRYQLSGKAALLEPARDAAAGVLARMEDEKEEVAVRLHAVNQWTVIQIPSQASTSGAARPPTLVAARTDELHPHALWIGALCRALKSPASAIRYRAGEILIHSFQTGPGTDPSFREAWRKAVPTVAEATKSADVKVRNGALAILSMLGPEAPAALAPLRTLARDSQDSSVRSAAQAAIDSISCGDRLKASDPTVRIAAAELVGRLDWRATPALPALIATLRDPEPKVRVAAVGALEALGQVSESAVQPLATALAHEADPTVRAAIVGALEAIAPKTPAMLDAHMNALRDPDPAVREAGARFERVPADDSLVAALVTALGDPKEEVRTTVASSLTEILFRSRLVVPALLMAMRDDTQRKVVLEALRGHLSDTSDADELSRVRDDFAGLRATLAAAIPALKEALSSTDDEIRPLVFGLLGRIVTFSRQGRDEELRKAIEPALQLYLLGLDEKDPSIREEVIGRLAAIPIRRADSVAALTTFLERSELPEQERQNARRAMTALEKAASSRAGAGAGEGLGGFRRGARGRD